MQLIQKNFVGVHSWHFLGCPLLSLFSICFYEKTNSTIMDWMPMMPDGDNNENPHTPEEQKKILTRVIIGLVLLIVFLVVYFEYFK